MKKIVWSLAALLGAWIIWSYVEYYIFYYERPEPPLIITVHPTMFSERVNQCTNIPKIPFDHPRKKHTYTLCKIGLEKYCIRTSPVEEQEYFYVIAPIYSMNQDANQILYELHTNFKHYCEALGVKYVQVEYAFSFQNYLVTKPDNEPEDIQIKGYNIFYLRENLVNVAERKLPEDYEYISWIDAHVYFDNPYIFQETIVKLGKSNIVAPHSIVRFKDKSNITTNQREYPFPYQAYYYNGTPIYESKYNVFPYYGLAFTTRKEIFRALPEGGLPDRCIAGVCDLYLSNALTNGTRPIDCESHRYWKWTCDYVYEASHVFKGKFDYVRSTIIHLDHYWALRRQSNWAAAQGKLITRDFDPHNDLARDSNGTLYLKSNFELAYDYWKFYSSI